MKTLLRLLSVSILFIYSTSFAQAVYMEVGMNTLGSVNYSHDDLVSDSDFSLSAQHRIEVGLKFKQSDQSNLTLGISTDAHSYYNSVFVPVTADRDIEVQSLFDLNYMGANLGFEHSVYADQKINIHANFRLAGSILASGNRTDQALNAPSHDYMNTSSNLLLEDFKRVWVSLQFGYMISHELSDLATLSFRHFINKNLSENKISSESYNFSSHAFSVGLILYPWSE